MIEIGKDFSRTPGGRFISDGPDSGELFRDRLLVPALREAIKEGKKLVVVMDGPRGYLSSFIEEAFGGLVRYRFFDKREIKKYLEVRANDTFYDTYRKLAQKCIDDAEPKHPDGRSEAKRVAIAS